MMDFSFSTVGKIVFGLGRIRDIGAEVSALGSRVLLVTGRGFLRRTGRLVEIEESMRSRGAIVTVFEQVPPEPYLGIVESGIAECRGHGCDVIVAVGGGSAVDVGKTIAALVGASGDVREYLHGREIERKGLPFVAVPTTSGSGAEVTPNAVLIDQERGVKSSIRSVYMLADVAIIDPELTLSLPPDVTAYSGMDALSQAMEALVSQGATPLTDALASDAAARLIGSLVSAYEDGDNLESRTEVALGSLMGGIAFANARLGLVHGLAHPLGVITGLPHGLICGLLLPIVVRFNAEVSGEKYAQLARKTGVVGSETSTDEAVGALVDVLDRMNAEMKINDRRSEIRIERRTWPAVVSQTLASGSTKSNPRSVTAEDVERLLARL